MAGENAAVRSLFVMEETGGYPTIADATGAAAVFVPCEDENRLRSERAVIPRAFKTGRNKRVPHRAGPKKGSRNIRALLHGFPASVAVAGDPPPATLTWFEMLLRTVLRAASSHDASVVGAGSTTGSIVTATNEMNIGDLMCLRGPVTNGARAMWARAQNAASPILVSPALPAAPVNGDVSYAVRTYSPAVNPGESITGLGNTLTLIENQDGRHYAGPGSVLNSLTIGADAGGELMVDAAVTCDSRLRQQFAALPDAPINDPEPIIFTNSRVYINGSELDVTSAAVEFGIRYHELKSPRGANGRQRPRITGIHPVLRIDPLNDDDFEDMFNNDTIFEVLVQWGEGSLFESRLNTIAFHCEGAQVLADPNEQADGDIERKPLEIGPADVAAGTGYQSFYWQLGIV